MFLNFSLSRGSSELTNSYTSLPRQLSARLVLHARTVSLTIILVLASLSKAPLSLFLNTIAL